MSRALYDITVLAEDEEGHELEVRYRGAETPYTDTEVAALEKEAAKVFTSWFGHEPYEVTSTDSMRIKADR